MNDPNFVNKLKHINLNKACRMCITQKSCLKEMYKTRIPKMIEYCTSVKVFENDELPHQICITCFHMITKLYSFRKKIERNDKILKDFIGKKEKEHKDIINIALRDAEITEPVQTVNEIKNLNLEPKLKQTNLTENLPPLIPFGSSENINVSKRVKNVRELPKDTPPLIPIKPLTDIETLVNVAPELEYKCYLCNKKFKNISELKKHKLDKCKPKKLQCNVCLKEFQEPKKLIGHLKGHVVVKDHLCKLCGKKYPNYSTFIVHMRSHTGERPFKCQICQKGFVRWASVRLHMKSHEDKRPYACDMCPKAFKISSNLERHKRTHFGIEPFSCSYCQKSYSQQENLTMHIRTYHTNERPFLCNICGKGFVNSTRLNRHMWIHSGTKPYTCRLCPKSYLNRIDLKNHETQHLGNNANELKNYACDKCNKKFFHPCRLAKHKRIHEVKCDVCNKVIESKDLYKGHLRNEHGFDECEEEQFRMQFKEIAIQHDRDEKKIMPVFKEEKKESAE